MRNITPPKVPGRLYAQHYSTHLCVHRVYSTHLGVHRVYYSFLGILGRCTAASPDIPGVYCTHLGVPGVCTLPTWVS